MSLVPLPAALCVGILAGAGLDVLEGEGFLAHEDELLSQPGAEEKLKAVVRNHTLQRWANVAITPHIAFNSEEALRRILDITAKNVRASSPAKTSSETRARSSGQHSVANAGASPLATLSRYGRYPLHDIRR